MARITSGFAFQLVRVIALLLTCSATFTYASSGQSNTAVLQTDACSVPTVDGSPDIKSLKYFMASIRELLSEERFAALDCIADGARTSKARFASGGWKLNMFYLAIVEPQGHATKEDSAAHLATLDRWVSARPKSVTARVAMADAYTSYAWNGEARALRILLLRMGGSYLVSGSTERKRFFKKLPNLMPNALIGTKSCKPWHWRRAGI